MSLSGNSVCCDCGDRYAAQTAASRVVSTLSDAGVSSPEHEPGQKCMENQL